MNLPERGAYHVPVKDPPIYFKSGRAKFTHIVKSAKDHYLNGALSHRSFTLRCHQIGFLSDDKKNRGNKAYKKLPKGHTVCLICYNSLAHSQLKVKPDG